MLEISRLRFADASIQTTPSSPLKVPTKTEDDGVFPVEVSLFGSFTDRVGEIARMLEALTGTAPKVSYTYTFSVKSAKELSPSSWEVEVPGKPGNYPVKINLKVSITSFPGRYKPIRRTIIRTVKGVIAVKPSIESIRFTKSEYQLESGYATKLSVEVTNQAAKGSYYYYWTVGGKSYPTENPTTTYTPNFSEKECPQTIKASVILCDKKSGCLLDEAQADLTIVYPGKPEDTVKEFPQKSLISITPNNLKAVPGREYTFRIEIADYEKYKRKDKLSLTCQGREKIKNGVLIIKKTFHQKIGTTKKFTVQLHQYPGPKILAAVTAKIKMVKNSACWTLVDCHTYETGKSNLLTYKIDKKECHMESSMVPPSFTGKKFKFGYLNSWKSPPQQLFPNAKMQIPVTFTRLHTCAGFNPKGLSKLSSNAYNAHGKEKVKFLKEKADYDTCLGNCYIDKEHSGGWERANPPETSIAWFTDDEFSKKVENTPWKSGSLNKSTAQLESGSIKTKSLLTQIVPAGIQEDRYDKNKPNLISFHIQITNSFHYNSSYDNINSKSSDRCRIGIVYVYKWDPTGNQVGKSGGK